MPLACSKLTRERRNMAATSMAFAMKCKEGTRSMKQTVGCEPSKRESSQEEITGGIQIQTNNMHPRAANALKQTANGKYMRLWNAASVGMLMRPHTGLGIWVGLDECSMAA